MSAEGVKGFLRTLGTPIETESTKKTRLPLRSWRGLTFGSGA